MNHKAEPWRSSLVGPAELDALLDRLREDKADATGKNRNAVAYDCWRMFENLANRFKEESAMRDRYKSQLNAWRDKTLGLNGILLIVCQELDYDSSNWLLIRPDVKKAISYENRPR